MLRILLLVATVILSVGQIVASASAQSQSLPVVDSGGNPGPLKGYQLDPEERVRFASLPPGSDDARQFLYTRGYLRFCRLVVAGTKPPLEFPRLPERVDWDRQFLSKEEAESVVDAALGMKILARMQQAPAQ